MPNEKHIPIAGSSPALKIFKRALGVGYLAYIIHTLTYLALIPLLYQYLDNEQVGLFLLIISISNFSAIGVGWLSGEGLARLTQSLALNDQHELTNRYMAILFSFGLYGLMLSIFAALFGAVVHQHQLFAFSEATHRDLANACFVFSGYIFIAYLHNADILTFTAALRQDIVGLLRISSSLLSLILAYSIFSYIPTLTAMLTCYLLAYSVAFLSGQIILRKLLSLPAPSLRNLHFSEVRCLGSSSGRRYFLYGIVQQLVYYSDTFLVGFLLGPTTVAVYITIWKFVDVTVMLLSRIGDTLVPYWMRLRAVNDDLRASRLTYIGSQITFACAIMAGIYYALSAESLLELWLGEEVVSNMGVGFAAPGIALFLLGSTRLEVARMYAIGRTNFISVCLLVEVCMRFLGLAVFEEFRELRYYLWLVVFAQFFCTWLPLVRNLIQFINVRDALIVCLTILGAGIVVLIGNHMFLTWEPISRSIVLGFYVCSMAIALIVVVTRRGKRLADLF